MSLIFVSWFPIQSGNINFLRCNLVIVLLSVCDYCITNHPKLGCENNHRLFSSWICSPASGLASGGGGSSGLCWAFSFCGGLCLPWPGSPRVSVLGWNGLLLLHVFLQAPPDSPGAVCLAAGRVPKDEWNMQGLLRPKLRMGKCFPVHFIGQTSQTQPRSKE